MAGSLLTAFRHLGLPDPGLRKASIKTLRFRLFEVPGRLTRGQRKTRLHLPAGWPWTPDLTTASQTIKTLSIPSDPDRTDDQERSTRHVEPGATDATVGRAPAHRTETMVKNPGPPIQALPLPDP